MDMKRLVFAAIALIIVAAATVFFSWDILGALIPPNDMTHIKKLARELSETKDRLPAPDAQTASPKLMVIIVDALSYNILELGFKNGLLSNFKRLFASYCAGALLPSMPMRTPRLLTSMATGVPADMHGILDFVADGKKPVTGAERRFHAFWRVASERGLKVAVVGWPFTWPAERVNGYFFAAPGLQSLNLKIYECCYESNPDGLIYQPATDEMRNIVAAALKEAESFGTTDILRPRIRSAALFWPLRLNPFFSLKRDFRTNKLAESLRRDKFFFGVAKRILARDDDIDIFALYIESTDVVGHMFFHDPRNLLGVYSWVDSELGELLKLAKGQPLLFISGDHGMRPAPRNLKQGYEEIIKGLDWPQAGVHDPIGALLIAAPRCARTHEFVSVRAEEVAPWVLSVFGIPPSREMQDLSLAEWYLGEKPPAGNYSTRRTPVGISPLDIMRNPRITDEYEDQLRALGYL